MGLLFTAPTHPDEQVRAGDLCYSQAGMQGVVLRVISHQSGKAIRVLWENCHEGNCSIETVRRLEQGMGDRLDRAYDKLVTRFLSRDLADDGRLDGCDAFRDTLLSEQTALREKISALRLTQFIDG